MTAETPKPTRVVVLGGSAAALIHPAVPPPTITILFTVASACRSGPPGPAGRCRRSLQGSLELVQGAEQVPAAIFLVVDDLLR